MSEAKKNTVLNQTTVVSSIIVLVVIASIISALFFYTRYQSLQKKIANPQVVADTELDQILSKMNKLIELPQAERPTLATVTNKEQLTRQPFFAKAKKGDKVLVYKDAKIAYLYRPSTNKIINVGPVNIATPTISTPSSISPSTSVNNTSPTISTRTTPTVTPTPTPTTTPVQN